VLPDRPRDAFWWGATLALFWAALTRPWQLLACLGCLVLMALLIALFVVATVVALFEWWLAPIGLAVLALVLVREQLRIERRVARGEGGPPDGGRGKPTTRR
jgi:peptidoglycan/LPS O-acetylase OafA/YrhL